MLARGLLARADSDKNGQLSWAEVQTALDALWKEADSDRDGQLTENESHVALTSVFPVPPGFGPGGGPPGFGRAPREPGKPGPRVTPDQVQNHLDAKLYDPQVLRTIFLEFENSDWEAELADFRSTDVDVPARMIVDGKTYAPVGVHFRGMSSYMMIPAGSKRSLNVSIDLVDSEQRLYGYKTLNLLNANDDPSLLSTVLYSHIASQHIPVPKANFVKVVINGESWGVYVNVQQFDKEFLAEHYPSTKGARWKVSGSPGGGGGLDYVGDNIEDYRRRYEIKSKDRDEDWQALIKLCKTMHETPVEKLEEALQPQLDIDGLLWFLALDVVLINNDGYWVRASDYSIHRDEKGIFHILPHDMNEAFHGAMMGPGGPGGPGGRGPGGFGRPGGFPGGPSFPGGPGPADGIGPPNQVDRGPGAPGGFPGGPGAPGGPGGPGGFGARGGPAGGGVALDPLVSLEDARKPLRSKVLAVPSLRARYLEFVRQLADKSLDWNQLGPIVARYRELLDAEVKADTRKLASYEAFLAATADQAPEANAERGRHLPLREFVEQRRAFLLNYHPPAAR